MDFGGKINIFDAEHAESAIEVSNSLEAIRGFAELTLKVPLRMGAQIIGFPMENQCFRCWTSRKCDRGFKFA